MQTFGVVASYSKSILKTFIFYTSKRYFIDGKKSDDTPHLRNIVTYSTMIIWKKPSVNPQTFAKLNVYWT